MTKEQKNKWICHECRSKLPKVGNTNTPVRNVREDEEEVSKICDTDIGTENITTREKQSYSQLIPGYTGSLQDRNTLVSAISDQVLKATKTELPQILRMTCLIYIVFRNSIF
ncbi:unnamed protein product [Pieris brassicae]|uniref:Uncharacterized protein n=1 Tax=Pieris brassicae TaxID=7116 RepID=A0A9P0SB16_PIEBR|nr:unnamed protein product [Pieris brassicae]